MKTGSENGKGKKVIIVLIYSAIITKSYKGTWKTDGNIHINRQLFRTAST